MQNFHPEFFARRRKEVVIHGVDCDLFFCFVALYFVHGAGDTVTVYLDMVFVLNLAINYLLLRGTARLGAAAVRRMRLWLAAAFGALYAVGVYLPGCAWLTEMGMKLLTAAGMLLIAYGWKPSTLRLAAVFALLSLVLCGAVYGVQAIQGQPFAFGEHLLYPVSFATLLLTALAVSLACRLLLPRLDHAADSILPLELELQGRRVCLTALRDSGNTLTDPISGAPVLTVYWKAAQALFPSGVTAEDFAAPSALALRLRALSPRLIPYRAVGVSGGLLLALPCSITLGKQSRLGLVAFSPTPVSDGGAYDALTGGFVYA